MGGHGEVLGPSRDPANCDGGYADAMKLVHYIISPTERETCVLRTLTCIRLLPIFYEVITRRLVGMKTTFMLT